MATLLAHTWMGLVFILVSATAFASEGCDYFETIEGHLSGYQNIAIIEVLSTTELDSFRLLDSELTENDEESVRSAIDEGYYHPYLFLVQSLWRGDDVDVGDTLVGGGNGEQPFVAGHKYLIAFNYSPGYGETQKKVIASCLYLDITDRVTYIGLQQARFVPFDEALRLIYVFASEAETTKSE